MAEHGPEPHPLHDKYPELHNEPDVATAAARAERRTGERPHQPGEKIDVWMETLEHIHIGRDEATAQRIKDVYHRRFVMQPDQVPETYFVLQQRIAREQGHGDVEISPAARRELAETITRDQESSLDGWIDYLSSDDAAYPMWFKYYTFRNVVKLAEYDKEKHEFKKRGRSTTGPFPDINREALGYMADALASHYGITDRAEEDQPDEIEPSIKQLLDRDASFAKLYAQTIELIHPATAEELAVTDGEWVKYDQGGDGKTLAKTLQGHGTGWCTAGEATAQAQLDNGDFYVYYTKNHGGSYEVPRVAVRMQQGTIAEVRGIEYKQGLESSLIVITQAKMDELPGAEAYQKRVADMQALTAIEAKLEDGEELTGDELSFLYEIEAPIEGFGYKTDPRIDELRGQRDMLGDYAAIFVLDPHDQSAIAHKIIESGKGGVVSSRPELFPDITPLARAQMLIDYGHIDLVATSLDQYTNLDSTIVDQLLADGSGDAVAFHIESFTGIDYGVVADKILDWGAPVAVAENIDKFSGLGISTANKLINHLQGTVVSGHLGSFTFTSGERDEILRSVARKIVPELLQYVMNGTVFESELAQELIDTDRTWLLAEHLDDFLNLSPQIAEQLAERGEQLALRQHSSRFRGGEFTVDDAIYAARSIHTDLVDEDRHDEDLLLDDDFWDEFGDDL